MEVARDCILHRTLVERVLNFYISDTRRILSHMNGSVIDCGAANLTCIVHSSS